MPLAAIWRGNDGFSSVRRKPAGQQHCKKTHEPGAVTRPAFERILLTMQDQFMRSEFGAHVGAGAQFAYGLGIAGYAGKRDADDGRVGEDGRDTLVVETGDHVIGSGLWSGAREDGVFGAIEGAQRLNLLACHAKLIAGAR